MSPRRANAARTTEARRGGAPQPGRRGAPPPRARAAKILLAAALAGCGSHPSQGDCEKIAEHMITIFTTPRPADDGKVPKEVEQATEVWRKNLTEKDRDPTKSVIVEVCRSEMGRGATSCILDATDEVTLAKCFGG